MKLTNDMLRNILSATNDRWSFENLKKLKTKVSWKFNASENHRKINEREIIKIDGKSAFCIIDINDICLGVDEFELTGYIMPVLTEENLSFLNFMTDERFDTGFGIDVEFINNEFIGKFVFE